LVDIELCEEDEFDGFFFFDRRRWGVQCGFIVVCMRMRRWARLGGRNSWERGIGALERFKGYG